MIITPNKFALLIEDMVKNKRMSYMDAVISYCSENGIDPSNTKGLINKTLKEKIAYEAQSLNMLKEKKAVYVLLDLETEAVFYRMVISYFVHLMI